MRKHHEASHYIDIPVRVRYADTDRMGVVYNGNYATYFEIGRSEYMRQKGFTYKEFEDMGYHLVVVALEARYYNNAGYDDLIVVKTGISELKSRSVTFHYKVYKDETLLVEGSTQHICTNTSKKAIVIPQALMDILKDALS